MAEKQPPAYPTIPEPVNYQAAPAQPPTPANSTTVILQAPGVNTYGTTYYTVPGGTAPVIVQQPALITGYGAGYYGRSPQGVTCPVCKQNVITRISYEAGTGSWLICLGIFFLGFFFIIPWCGFCFIPFCVNDLKDVKHHCPSCNTYLGAKNLM